MAKGLLALSFTPKSGAVQRVRANVKQIAVATPTIAMRVAYRWAEGVMLIAKTSRVPVRFGDLRNSGLVTPDPGRMRVNLSFGSGPAAKYAVDQHENVTYKHKIGGPFYLRDPVNENAPLFYAMLAKELKK